MIQIEPYEQSVANKYWEYVNFVINLSTQQAILKSCKKFMPPDFFSQNASFEELVLAPYGKIKEAYKYIEKHISDVQMECFKEESQDKRGMKPLYKMLYDSYDKISQKITDGVKMNVFLVQNTGLTVCPYCNRDYINCRSKTLTGAQLDHFYPRSKFPIFSVCLYNLVPVCGTCNRIKNDDTHDFASPFDEEIDWENDIRFSYDLLDNKRIKITIDAKPPIEQNIRAMRIENAYEIHETEVKELREKAQMYQDTQLEEFNKVLGEAGVTQQEMKTMVFGPEITKESMRKRPLGRMLRDLERELGIY